MFSLFRNKTDLKGFKVCLNSERSKKYGIAADSLKTLVDKIKSKFELNEFEIFFDGTIVNEENFFKTIPNNSQIVVVKNGEEYKTDYEIIFELFRKTYHETFHARDLIKDFLSNQQNENILQAVIKMHSEIEEKTKKSTKEEHPEWFSGSDNKKSKEEVMKQKAKDRIKGYFYKAKDELTKSKSYRFNAQGRKIINDLLDDFFLFLNGVEYFECLFDRSHCEKFRVPIVSDEIDAKVFVKRRKIDSDTKSKIKDSNIFEKYCVSLCNDIGNFNCDGKWRDQKCDYDHKINPYSSRESLVLFQIYNLDHQVEISRSIFPSILKNVEKLCEGNDLKCEDHNRDCIQLSTLTYFLEIFTVKNLKLVHIICHDKASHDLKTKATLLCDQCKEYKILKKLKLKLL